VDSSKKILKQACLPCPQRELEEAAAALAEAGGRQAAAKLATAESQLAQHTAEAEVQEQALKQQVAAPPPCTKGLRGA
jgi:hypothetical protein